MKTLTDSHGRTVRKLRLSLTDKCNLRCHYCMPVDATFMDEKKYLTANEYQKIVQELCDYGLQELRLTGGEPLLRRDFVDIISSFADLPLKKIGLTTNGIFLDKYLEDLKRNRVHYLNISLDSLNEENFRKITFGNHLKRILHNIDAALAMNFSIKVNVVAMRGVNDHELFDFVEYAQRKSVEVRFLEVMKIGYACNSQEEQFISAREMIAKLNTKYTLKPIVREHDSTSFNYLLDNNAQIGFIASESQAFCGQCSRWRLTSDGIMRACLFKDDGLEIKNKSAPERAEIYQSLLGMKPIGRPSEVSHLMHAIGG